MKLIYKFITNGFFFYQSGTDSSKLQFGYSNRETEFNSPENQFCLLDDPESVSIFVSLSNGILTVSKSEEGKPGYQKCGQINIQDKWIKSFYMTMFGYSGPSSNFRIDLKTLILSTEIENLGISEFESRFDENDHKLFRQIHYFSVNKNETDRYIKDFNTDSEIIPLNISQIYDTQSKIYTIFDYANVLLEKNIESTDDIISFLDQQKEAIDDYSKKMLSSMTNWINQTKFEFEVMEKDTLNIISEFKSFDLDSEFQITKNLLVLLKNKFNDNYEKLSDLKKYGKEIKSNLQYIKDKKNELNDLPDQIKSYIDALEESSKSSSGGFLMMFLVATGAFVLVSLIAIYWRLSKNKEHIHLGGV